MASALYVYMEAKIIGIVPRKIYFLIATKNAGEGYGGQNPKHVIVKVFAEFFCFQLAIADMN